MKRRAVLRYLHSHGCVFLREGRRHTVYRNPAVGLQTAVPRHTEIAEPTVWKICQDLRIPAPGEAVPDPEADADPAE